MTETFRLSLDLLLLANSRYLRHVISRDDEKVRAYAAMPAATAPPIRIRKDNSVADGFHRLAAAKLRCDADVLCCHASTQEELSAR